ncbi:hypothetical protein VP01_2942g1 [Puccinia sorghi]|uniref:Integrase catalytic domain-containing protein n=1 Tax=Puccinia sorghi TaxID=27349 RepID=A0A0L6V101_9BASI|nr:hypothetical protein VP01_2942g1 [Puccinia sorghi]
MHDGFRQAMLKTALETIPQLTEENYSIWKDKMTALLKLRGVFTRLDQLLIPLGESDDAELTLLIISKMDSVTHNNVVTANNRESAQKLWHAIKERFSSSQASNRARIFNDFLYIKFLEDGVENFVTSVKVAIKKMVNVGIDLPQDILLYLVLFKFPTSLQILKRQIMHSDKELSVEFVCNHLIQFNNESKAEIKDPSTSTEPAALFNNKDRKQAKPNSSSNSQKRCKSGFHNPKQDANHSSDSCWHLHPDKAPDWWRESQAQWKAGRENKEKSENYFMSLLTLWIESGDPNSRIILDSGASGHIFNDLKFFDDVELGNFDFIKTGKKDATLPIRGKGSVVLTWGTKSVKLENCLYVPDIVINLISAGQLVNNGCTLYSGNHKFTVKKGSQPAFGGKITNGLFSVDNPDSVGKSSSTMANLSEISESLQELHERFGHASVQRIAHLSKTKFSNSELSSFECKSCVLSKITKQAFKFESELAKKPFERLHLDIVGPIKPESSLKHNYILTVVDNYLGYLAGFPLVHKNDTTDALIDLLEAEKKRRGYYPSLICSDGGGEFTGIRLVQYLTRNHIRRLISEPYHPEHNGRAERANRTIVESVRATIMSSGIQKRFWHEVLKSCCLALNQIPKKGQTDSPWEILHGRKFPSDYLKPIGTPAVILQMPRKEKSWKFNPKGEEGVLVGFNVSLVSYRILTPFGKVIETKHVRFLKKDSQNLNFDLDELVEAKAPLESETTGDNSRDENPAEEAPSTHRENENNSEAEELSSINEDEEVENQLTHDTQPQQENIPSPPTSTRVLRDRSQIKPPSPKNWYETLTAWLNSLGFYESNCDPCLYICDDRVSVVFFHVDDLVLVGPGNDFEKEFESRFNNSSCHEPNTILGMKFEKSSNKIHLSLPNHIQHGLEELGLEDSKISSTPLTPNLKLRDASDDDHSRFKKLNINYRSAIGLLNHIAQLTRPDISFAVSSLARFSVKPGMTHWHEVKKVWQYLKGTIDLKLTLEIREPSQLLQIYSDASWGDDPQDRTSQSGYICFLFGSIIAWNSSKQRSVTYSSTKAELNPLVDSFHEGVWLKALLAEIWNIQIDAASHLIDNQELKERLMMSDEEFEEKFSNQHLIDNKGLDDKVKKFGSNPKTRHIDLKTKGIRQEVKHNTIRIDLIRTHEMVADALTKAAPKSSISNLVKTIDPQFDLA